MKGYIFLILIVFPTSCGASPDCDSFDDCVSCTKHESWIGDNCRWCPLDKQCHAYASLKNTCREEQNVHVPLQCSRQTRGVYSPETAYTATLLSALAYSDNPTACVNSIFPNGGFELHYAVGQKCEDLPLFEYDECYAYIAVSHVNKTIVLAFRGTITEKGNQLYDEMLSVLIKPKENFMIGGEVQVYFKKAFNKLSPCVYASVTELVRQNPDYDVIVTGHSLGGAIASLSAAALIWTGIVPSNKLSLYTFGMPRVGDKGYALKHDEIVNNSWRVVHARDIVPHIPTCNLITGCSVTADGPYHHGIEIFYPESDMTKSSRYIQCKGDEDDGCSDGLVTENWCLPDLDQCIKYHKNYFEIPVGTYCRDRGAGIDRKRRGINRSLMWEKFSSKSCRRISLNESSVLFGSVVKTDLKNTNEPNTNKPAASAASKIHGGIVTFVIFVIFKNSFS